VRQARAWNPALEPSAGAAARRAARIYNKHLDALCEHEPLTQMVLRAGDITWFDPNWYQTARAPRPSSHPSAAAAPPCPQVWPCAVCNCLAPASPAVGRRRAGCLHQWQLLAGAPCSVHGSWAGACVARPTMCKALVRHG